MKLKNRGFAVTSIIYSMLVLFLALLLLITSNLASRKVLFDKEKKEILDKLNGADLCELVKRNGDLDTLTIGDKYSCNFGGGDRNFYVLEINDTSNKVALILEGNYDTETFAWCASGSDNSCAADGLSAKLDEIASVWTKLDRSQIAIPSMSLISVADGQDEDAYLGYEGLNNEWLYSYPDYAEWSDYKTAPNGYWTSTPDVDEASQAWYVYYNGMMMSDSDGLVSSDNYCGVRPVVNLSIDELIQ